VLTGATGQGSPPHCSSRRGWSWRRTAAGSTWQEKQQATAAPSRLFRHLRLRLHLAAPRSAPAAAPAQRLAAAAAMANSRRSSRCCTSASQTLRLGCSTGWWPSCSSGPARPPSPKAWAACQLHCTSAALAPLSLCATLHFTALHCTACAVCSAQLAPSTPGLAMSPAAHPTPTLPLLTLCPRSGGSRRPT
jgi:hypothetical protein